MTTARPALLERLFPKPDVDLDALVEEVALCESGSPEAMRAVLEATGKLVARRDVLGAAGGIGEEAFVELLFDVGPDTVGDDEVVALLELVQAGTLSEADLHRAVTLAERSLDQPALSDLVFYPREDFAAARIVELARAHRGAALAPFLDPQVGEPASERPSPPSPRLPEARVALLDMHEAGEIELGSGEHAAASFAALLDRTTDLEGFLAWLESGDNGVAEVIGDEEALAARWSALHGE